MASAAGGGSIHDPLREMPMPTTPAAVAATSRSIAAHAPTLPARRLERLLGKPAAAWTIDDLVALVRDHGIRVVSLMHTGGDATLKTLDFVPRHEAHLRAILHGGERADGSSLFAGTGIAAGASDILLRPRLQSAFLDPFAAEPTLALLCSHLGRDHRPLPVSPDSIVRAADARVRSELKLDLLALGEVEFFLGRRGDEADAPGADDRGYHAASPAVFGERLRRQALVLLAEIGVPIKYGHSEVGYIAGARPDDLVWEQHEIEMALAPLPEAADHVVLTQWVVRNLAHQGGMRCSFEPITQAGHAGSGMHFHFSPCRDGEHLGRCDEDGRLSPTAQWLVAGLCRHGAALMAFGNRRASSFQRLLQGKETPTAVGWGRFDRGALVRIPITVCDEDGRELAPPTIEFRLPDASAHPHLLLAAAAQAMVSGRSTSDLPRMIAAAAASELRRDAAGASRLPTTPREVTAALAQHRDVFAAGGVFPAALLDHALATSPTS